MDKWKPNTDNIQTPAAGNAKAPYYSAATAIQGQVSNFESRPSEGDKEGRLFTWSFILHSYDASGTKLNTFPVQMRFVSSGQIVNGHTVSVRGGFNRDGLFNAYQIDDTSTGARITQYREPAFAKFMKVALLAVVLASLAISWKKIYDGSKLVQQAFNKQPHINTDSNGFPIVPTGQGNSTNPTNHPTTSTNSTSPTAFCDAALAHAGANASTTCQFTPSNGGPQKYGAVVGPTGTIAATHRTRAQIDDQFAREKKYCLSEKSRSPKQTVQECEKAANEEYINDLKMEGYMSFK